MSRFIPRRLFAACTLVLAWHAYALCADVPKEKDLNAGDFNGEIVLVESKSGSSVGIEQPRIRVIAGVSFVSGLVLYEDSFTKDSDAVACDRILIPVAEVSRILEFDTKARFAARGEIHKMMAKKVRLEKQLRSVQSDSPRYKELIETLQKLEDQFAKRGEQTVEPGQK